MAHHVNHIDLKKTKAVGHENNICYNLTYFGVIHMLSFYQDGDNDTWFVQVSKIAGRRLDESMAIYYPDSNIQIASYPTLQSIIDTVMDYYYRGELLIEDFWY